MRVVITGMGIKSVLGLDLDTVSGALQAGQSGIIMDESRVEMGFRSGLTGTVRDFNVRDYVNRKQAKTMGEPAQYAVGASVDAVKDAGLPMDAFRDPLAGVIVGNDSCALPVVEMADILRSSKTTRHVGSGSIIQVMNSTVTMNLSTFFGVQGASWTVSAACASGAHALGQAFMLIKSGMQDLMLTGGAQEINWASMASFDALGAFATLKDGETPEVAIRPFSKERTGLVPSGGAAVLVLESLERAEARGAKIYAEVLSYAFSNDGDHMTQPGGDGAERAMRIAVDKAGHSLNEIEY
ncbi:beta-ketoacyl-[acyl-carrier-protein] synthase family protein, partial [Myxococcota bacterium]|nr:beta-ketoacyl-[acyl-carrier-protein] synthase family protein [Myxococcota bacterium]